MEIVKELNLNGNPHNVKNGSLVYGQNIHLSADGSFITNDEGFKIGTIESYSNTKGLPILKVKGVNAPNTVQSIDGDIVGNINCPNEIVIFTNTDKIYRLVECYNYDELCIIPIESDWTYGYGEINGTYIYNVEGDLIVAIGEYGNNNIPLKVINLNKSNIYDNRTFYTTAPDVPITNLYFNNYVTGNIPSGLYYFFVRYKFNNSYTKWFPIGKPYQATNKNYKRLIHHDYNIGMTSNSEVISTYVDANINQEGNCKYTFEFTLDVEEPYGYSHVQLGYIVQTDNGIFARANEEYKLDSNAINFIFNTLNSKEIGIDDIIRNPFRINNIRALTNFNNRLYVGNYDEIDSINNENQTILDFLSDNAITISSDNSYIEKDSSITPTNDIPVRLRLQNYDDVNHTNDKVNVEVTINTNNYEYTLDKTDANGIKIIDHLLSKGNVNGTSTIGINKYDSQGNVTQNYLDYVEALGGQDYKVKLNFSNNGFVVYYPPSNHGLVTYDIDAASDSNLYDFRILITNGSPAHRINLRQDLLIGVVVNTVYDEIINYDLANEVKTFMPNEAYNFYIHYIREDGSYTDGFLINNIPYVIQPISVNNNKIPKYGVKFNNIKSPDTNFTGCFITYSKLKTSFNLYVEEVQGNLIYGKATDYQLGLINPQNCKIVSLYLYDNANDSVNIIANADIPHSVLSIKSVLSNAYTQIGAIKVDRTNIDGVIAIEVDLNTGETILPDYKDRVMVVYENNVKNDELLQLNYLGYNLSFNSDDNYDYETDSYIYKEFIKNDIGTMIFNSSGFIVYDKYIKYINHIYQKTDNTVWKPDTIDFDDTDNLFNATYANLIKYPRYSSIYLNAISIKKEPESIESVHDNNRIIHNIIIEAANLSDLFQLKSDYLLNVYKSYMKYDENKPNIDKFTNGIRNSYPIRTESTEISWREFDAEDYYLIDKHLGEIVNILGVSKYLFIHTTHSLLIASSDATLTADNTKISLNQHKLFDIAPSELFSSDLGYGGLKYQFCQCFSINGYIWYDTDHHKVFKYDNNKFEDLTANIEEFIRKYQFEFCYFNIDNKTNRIFMSFTNDNVNYFTLAYSTLTNSFISFYNFKFTRNIHTTNNIYFADTIVRIGETNNTIYKYDITDFGDYKLLSTLNINSDIQSRIDIIINVSPETPKSLESIRWMHKYLHSDIIDENNYAELKQDNSLIIPNTLFKNTKNVADDLENLYLRIFNNNVDTGLISLFNEVLNDIENININTQQNIQSYKHPHYEKGVWQFNYFRDGILIDLTENDINSITDEQERNKWLKIVQGFDTKIINNVKHYYRLSDIQSLIYGTYFVISFVFKNPITYDIRFNKKVKFDSISTKINNY